MTHPGGTTGGERCRVDDPSRSSRWQSAALLGGLGVFSVSAAPPVGTDASEVSHWNQVAATTLAAFPGPNGGAPPAFQINMGMVQGAVYDAVNAIGPKQHQPYLLNRRAGAKASIDAAVATAAYDVLSELVSTAPETSSVPGSCGTPDYALHRVRGLARCDRQRRLQEAGHRDRARGGRGHARREGGRRTVRAVSVGAELRRRTLAAAPQCGGAADPRSDPMGGRREAVPHPELVAVPQRATARARQRAVGGRVQRGQEPRQSHRLDPD